MKFGISGVKYTCSHTQENRSNRPRTFYLQEIRHLPHSLYAKRSLGVPLLDVRGFVEAPAGYVALRRDATPQVY